jgi:hypothetical protein
MARLSTKSIEGGALVEWRWECPAHGWHGLWEHYRDCAMEGGMDHDEHYHGYVPDDD